MTINRNDKSTSISTQLDSLIPTSKISTLTQGIFIGSASHNFNERIEQKIFQAEIVVDNEKVVAETKVYQKIPEILSYMNEQGEDKMKQEIEANYKQIKSDILNIKRFSLINFQRAKPLLEVSPIIHAEIISSSVFEYWQLQ